MGKGMSIFAPDQKCSKPMTGQRGANAAAANEADAPANLPTENSGRDNVSIDLSLGEDWEDDGRSEDHVEPPPISADAYFVLTDEEKGEVPRDARGLPLGYWPGEPSHGVRQASGAA
jgi:hypothetical protein